MNLDNVNKITDDILKEFINYIGLDGEYFISNKTCPMIFSKISYPGDYISPAFKDKIESIISLFGDKISEKGKSIIRSRGVIRISNQYKCKDELHGDFLVTIIHEKLHSYRNLLVYDANLDDNLSSFLSNKNNFEQNNINYETFYADASQEILKGSIDNSYKTIKKYENKTLDELDDIEFADEKLNDQMNNQQIVDEALVEIMSILAYKNHACKSKNVVFDIWQELENIKKYDNFGDDIKSMCDLIIRHHDFELFYWMLDPIAYQIGDIHYDFFKSYTKSDKDLLEKIYDSSDLYMDDDNIDQLISKTR